MHCCKEHTGKCQGPVEYRWKGDGSGARPWCEFHHDEHLDTYQHALELMSPIPAPWFDESYAGERWDDEY